MLLGNFQRCLVHNRKAILNLAELAPIIGRSDALERIDLLGDVKKEKTFVKKPFRKNGSVVPQASFDFNTLQPWLMERLKAMGFTQPTSIQEILLKK